MKKNISYAGIAGLLALAPLAAFAQTPTLKTLACNSVSYIQLGIYLIIALAVVIFTWNVYRYFIASNLTDRKEAGLYVLYSVIGFFVILSLWGLVAIVTNSLNLPNSQSSSFSVLPSSSLCGGTAGSAGTIAPQGAFSNANVVPQMQVTNQQNYNSGLDTPSRSTSATNGENFNGGIPSQDMSNQPTFPTPDTPSRSADAGN